MNEIHVNYARMVYFNTTPGLLPTRTTTHQDNSPLGQLPHKYPSEQLLTNPGGELS